MKKSNGSELQYIAFKMIHIDTPTLGRTTLSRTTVSQATLTQTTQLERWNDECNIIRNVK